MRIQKLRDLALLSVVGSACAATQAATFTEVLAPPVDERSHEQIIEDLLGGDFSQMGNDFTDGLRTVTRIDDDSDQFYDFESWSAEAVAVWASASQSFGTFEDGPLFTAVGDGDSVSGSASDAEEASGIVFSRFGNQNQTVDVHTDPTLNSDGLDHVITYSFVTEGDDGPQTSYLLFFEDLAEGNFRADWDYNDLVVELTGVESDPVPEPGSLVLMGAGALAMFRRRR